MVEPRKKLPDYILLSFSILALIAVWTATDLDFRESFVVAYFIFTVLRFINNLGYTINIFDFLTFYSALDTLISPLIAYKHFNNTNKLAAIWGTFMRIPEDIYLDYLIPANIAFFIGLHLIFYKNARSALPYMQKARAYVANKTKVGIVFIIVGMLASQFSALVPGGLTFVFYLLSMLPYVGGFYVYFSIKKYRGLVMSLLVLIFFLQSARSGLFGECVMFTVLATCLIMSQFKYSFLSKLSFFALGFFLILVIQGSKGAYRAITWTDVKESKEEYRNKNNIEIFYEIFVDRLANPSRIITERSLFSLNVRFNQGKLISLAMNYVPRVEPYANGETIWLSLAAVVVPRFLWPDKPEAGGAANLARFVGIKRKLHYSMNIGPYGEGYGNFGVAGGVIFMFLYGMVIAYFLHKTLEKARKYPSIIIWVPMMFYYVLTVETDILSTMNSLVKIIVFMVIVYWICKKAYNIDI